MSLASYQGRRALVTGGAGFIGSHLTEALLARGAEVTVVDRESDSVPPNLRALIERVRLECLELDRGDLESLAAEERFDFVFHLAGNVVVPASVEQPAWDLRMNSLTTLRLLEALRKASPTSRFVYASTAAVYGEASDRPLREEDVPTPVAPYGASKLMGENYVRLYALLHGVSGASVRLFSIYGPRLRKHVVYDLITKLHADSETLEIRGDGGQVRDFTYVTDAVEAMLCVGAAAEMQGEVYNVATGRALSIRALAGAVCQAMGAQPRIQHSEVEGPGISRRWEAEVERLSALGFEARVPLAHGMAQTVRWFQEDVSSGSGPA